MNCSNCNKEIPDNAKFCGFCGEVQHKINTPVIDSGNNTNTVKKKKHGSFIINLIANIVFVIVIILLLIMVFNQSFIIDRRFDDKLFFVEDINTGKEYSYRLKGGLIESFPNVDDYFREQFNILDNKMNLINKEKKELEHIININKESSLYKVGPSVSLTPAKLNTIYIGIDNPISIKSYGFEPKDLILRTTQGKIIIKNNEYFLKLSQKVPENKIRVSASAKINGEITYLSETTFNVKRLPSPISTIAGKCDGIISKNSLLAAHAIITNNQDFELNISFEVTSFTFATIINGDWIPKNVRGNRFNKEISNIIRNGKRKQKFFFENIQAKGPDGTIRSLNPIILELK